MIHPQKQVVATEEKSIFLNEMSECIQTKYESWDDTDDVCGIIDKSPLSKHDFMVEFK